MGFLIDRWHGIGAPLYLALGFAVFLTLVSSAVGVYYFERSAEALVSALVWRLVSAWQLALV